MELKRNAHTESIGVTCECICPYERRYDGGAFFSPDSKRLLFRANHPTEAKEQNTYIHLRDAGLVMPDKMELFTVNVDGSDMRQVTSLGGSNWAPYFHRDGHHIIFASNYAYARGYPFNLFLIDERNTSARPERVTYDPDFDSFPMFSRDGSHLIWASGRNASQPGELNLFIADWIDKPQSQQPRRFSETLRQPQHEVRRHYRMRDTSKREVRATLLCSVFFLLTVLPYGDNHNHRYDYDCKLCYLTYGDMAIKN